MAEETIALSQSEDSGNKIGSGDGMWALTFAICFTVLVLWGVLLMRIRAVLLVCHVDIFVLYVQSWSGSLSFIWTESTSYIRHDFDSNYHKPTLRKHLCLQNIIGKYIYPKRKLFHKILKAKEYKKKTMLLGEKEEREIHASKVMTIQFIFH